MPEEQCKFEFAPGVRCLMVDGHDQPYYAYLDYGQSSWYSDTLSRGTPHQVIADAPEVPPRDEWTGRERRDSVQRWPAFKHESSDADLDAEYDARVGDGDKYAHESSEREQE